MAASVVESGAEVVPVPARYGRSRQALVDAMIELSARGGFHGVTVAELSVVAGVGPRTFYNHFADLTDVLFEACWRIHEDFRRAVQVAYDGAVVDRHEDVAALVGDGLARDRASACVEAVVAFVQADPARARVLFVESYAGGLAVAELRAETVGWLTGLLVGGDGSRGSERVAGPNVARLSAEFAVGGINGVLCSRIKADDVDGLSGLVPSFVDTLAQAGGGTGGLRVV